ncbi:MAG: aldose 1-epimerase family protein [Isosphaeraceae bacterium]|nr:aldose 1-epimerase family protein [Isosphaeraceae bacterium]
MPSFTLTDAARDTQLDNFSISAADLGLSPGVGPSWSVVKRTLHGGRREGVDLIRLDNGALSVDIVPTRGMSLRKGAFLGHPLGWRSPVSDGPVHPAFVNLQNWGGLGWLEGYDEMLVRCGLENNGAPYTETATSADGTSRQITYGLHGKIGYIPAHFVAVHVAPEPPHEITIEGHVDEAKLFNTQIRMITRISTVPGSNRLRVRDEFVNLKESPSEMQVLYHWNFGPPYLGEGSRFVAPMKTVLPRDPRAAEGIDRFDVYGAPEPGYAEQVYFFELLGRGPGARTLAMLRDSRGERAVAIRFSTEELRGFTLWKNTSGLAEGYVTGLEPATNYPNAKPFEKARGRVVTIPPGGRHVTDTTLEILEGAEAVAAAEAEIREIQGGSKPVIHPRPVEPFAPETPTAR